MVIAGMINRVAFYCRVNHRDRDYEKYLDDVMRRLEEEIASVTISGPIPSPLITAIFFSIFYPLFFRIYIIY